MRALGPIVRWRRARWLAALVWAASAGAWAQTSPSFQSRSVAGVPSDVNVSVTDAGYVGVASPSAASAFVVQGGTITDATAAITGNHVLVFFDPQNCLLRLETDGTFFDACTGASYELEQASGGDQVLRARPSADGRLYATANIDTATLQRFMFNTRSTNAPAAWVQRNLPVAAPNVAALRLGAVDYGVASNTLDELVLLADGGHPDGRLITASLGVTTRNIRDLELFGRDGGLQLLVGADTGLYRGTIINGGIALAGPPAVTTLSGVQVTGVSFQTGTGDEYGDGFGLAVAPGTAELVYSAIPDPANPALTWVPFHGPPAATLRRVSCDQAQVCAFTTDVATAGNVSVWENLNPPFVLPPFGTVNEDAAAPLRLRVDAGDPDGEAVFVRWHADGGTPLAFDLVSADGTTADLTPIPGAVCGVPQQAFPVSVSVSDGRAGHARFAEGTITVVHTLPPNPPSVSPATLSVPAGSEAITVSATPSAAGCPATAFDWRELSSPGLVTLEVSGAGDVARLTPPVALCAAQTATFGVYAFDGHLWSATGQTVSMTVNPWGVPDAGFPAGHRVSQESTVRVEYAPIDTHLCAGQAGFPGVVGQWTFTPGALGATVDVGGAAVSSGVFAPAVGVTFPDCTVGSFTLGTRLEVVDGGQPGPYSEVTIDVFTTYDPVQGTTPALTASYVPAERLVRGEVGTGVNCAPQRGLTADLSLVYAPTDGGVASVSGVPVPGPFELGADVGCAGGDYALRGHVRDPDGGTSAVASVPLQLPKLPVQLAALNGDTLAASCGAGGTGTLAAELAAGGCPSAEVSWTQLSGPALEPIAGGPVASLRTVQQTLDGLIGEKVVVRATADAGVDNGAVAEKELTIVADPPFVTVQHDTDVPVAEEGGLLGVRVRLTNTTACPVGNVSFVESLEGLRYVEGSAKLEGAPVVASAADGQLVFSGLTLGANQTRTLTYVARPVLLGQVRPAGQAQVKGVPISPLGGLPQRPEGCGCGASPSGALALAALLWLGARSRRRLTTRR